jgi:hypothetical protein
MTNVIFSASGYWAAIFSAKTAQSSLVFRSVISTIRFPAKGSLDINTEQTPRRLYS